MIGDKAVPIGSYTRQILTNLGLQSVLSNVVSNEQNVRDILTKVALGEADAGFVYITDAKTVPGKVNDDRAARAGRSRTCKYEIAVVKSSTNKAAAAAFIAQGAVASAAAEAPARRPASAPPKGTVTK